MKYGLLMTSVLKERKEEQCMNMGDMMQTLAIASIYERMGIPEDQIVEIGINDIMEYDGDYMILPININLSLNWCTNIFPLPAKILPVFIGLSYFSATDFPNSLREYFHAWAPIGCRDESTLHLMRRHRIPAYLFGCISATLPRRTQAPQNGKVFFVDVPDSLLPYIPKELCLESESFSHIYRGDAFLHLENVKAAGLQLLKKYRDEASLVVTARLHAMAPCLAMGIPVVAAVENCSPRMAWIDRLIPLYTRPEYAKIDWYPSSVNYEEMKEIMVKVAIGRIKHTAEKYQDVLKVSYFFESRKKAEYGNFYREILRQLTEPADSPFEYILWGAGQIGMNVYEILCESYPKSKMVGVIDSFCEGKFFGLEIQKPDKLQSLLQAGKKKYVFITTTSGEACALEKLVQLGKTVVGRDYLSFATKNG